MGDHSSTPVTGYPVHPNAHPPPAAAYPYQAPPPQQPPTNPSFYTTSNQNPYNYFYPNPNTTFLRRLIASILIVTVLFFLILFILWLVIRPRYPEFRVTSLTVSNFNVSASALKVTGNWDARFLVYNPNKKLKISYYQIESFVSYKADKLTQTQVPPFAQGTRNSTVVEATYSALEAYVGDSAGMAADRARGSVGFIVRVVADVGFKAGSFRARRRLLRVLCENVVVWFPGNGGAGNFTSGPKECLVFT